MMATDGVEPRRDLAHLPAYLLDLLDVEERRHLEQLLAEDATLRLALDRLREAARPLGEDAGSHAAEPDLDRLAAGTLATARRQEILEHLTACRECRFALAVGLATRGPAPVRVHPLRRLPRIRLGLAAAAAVVLGLAGLRWQAGQVTVRTNPVVRLGATRGAEPEIALRSSQAAGLTLLVETDFPAPAAGWRLLSDAGIETARGTLRFPASAPAYRTIAIDLPASRLTRGAYVLVLHSGDGTLERQWRLRIID